MMNYKGYVGEATYDNEANLLHGEVINMSDVVTFQSDDVVGLQQAFEDSVDDYLEFCELDGVAPDKPYSGKFQTRISPELHRDITLLAKIRHISLNALVEHALVGELNNLALAAQSKADESDLMIKIFGEKNTRESGNEPLANEKQAIHR